MSETVTNVSLTTLEMCALGCMGIIAFFLVLSLIWYWVTAIFGSSNANIDLDEPRWP